MSVNIAIPSFVMDAVNHGYQFVLARDAVRTRIDRYAERWRANGVGHLAAVRLEDGRFVGRVGFVVWDPVTWQPGVRHEIGPRAEIELGWALLRSCWGRGYATEAAAAARDWAFRELHLRRLISVIDPENPRSIAVAERLGAMLEREIETAEWGRMLLYVHPGQAPAR